MSFKKRTTKISDNGKIFWGLPEELKFPQDPKKYFVTYWTQDYTFNRLSYLVYGSTRYSTMIMYLNNIQDAYSVKIGTEIILLIPEYLNEVSNG